MVERRPRSLAEIATELEGGTPDPDARFSPSPAALDRWRCGLLLEALEACSRLVHMKSNQAALTRIIAAYRGEGKE